MKIIMLMLLLCLCIAPINAQKDVFNPVSTDKRNYWINENLVEDSEEWFNKATEMPGSWWKDYTGWLVHLSGKQIAAKKTAGNKEYKPLIDAPGDYVKAKALSIIEAEAL